MVGREAAAGKVGDYRPEAKLAALVRARRQKLSPSYNLLGYVVEGMDAALAVQRGDIMRTVAIEERPRAPRS